MKPLLLVLLVGCAGSTVRTQTTTTDGLIATARDNGAQKCAPVELAMAESHNDYAEHALDEGNYYDARREADVAATNAQSAFDKSPKDRCVGYGDRDGDGIKDNVDKCPDDPEDKDGFEDADGCPDDAKTGKKKAPKAPAPAAPAKAPAAAKPPAAPAVAPKKDGAK